jgi:hypothetical protein
MGCIRATWPAIIRPFSVTTQLTKKIGQPNAEGAEISQKEQPKIPIDDIFCGFCVTFAISAFGCPTLNARAEQLPFPMRNMPKAQ